jgi:murein DD-endopeptidase MepM/ murein hydrolase activator NlpD
VTPLARNLLRYVALEGGVLLVALGLAFGTDRILNPPPPPFGEYVFKQKEPEKEPTPVRSLVERDHDAPVSEADAKAPLEPEAFHVLDIKKLRAKRLKVVEYQVKLGENYWSVAKKFNVDVSTILGANPDMPFVSRVKQELLVPDREGVLHAVAKAEKLEAVAELYQVKIEDLKKENSIPWWRGLREGDVLFVAGAKPVHMDDQWRGYYSHRGMFGVPFATWGKGWSSRYGMRSDPLTGEKRKHGGMDFKASYGVDVFASAGGRVTFAGVSGGYGNLITISHGKGYVTYYGHLSKIYVKQGQRVRRGQRIAKVGATGRVTGPHLHFEIRKNGRTIDPLPLI